MGKEARLRAARKKAREQGTQQPVPKAPESMLIEAAKAVGERFGIQPQCVEAACMLQHAGRLLGYELTVRPVSVLAIDKATNSTAFMGPKASAMMSERDRELATDYRPHSRDAGHVVLTCEDPQLLLDPNMRQLASYGIDAPGVVLKIKSLHPDSGQWHFQQNGLDIYYLVDDDNRALLGNYDAISKSWQREAADVVRLLRGGSTADDIVWGRAQA